MFWPFTSTLCVFVSSSMHKLTSLKSLSKVREPFVSDGTFKALTALMARTARLQLVCFRVLNLFTSLHLNLI